MSEGPTNQVPWKAYYEGGGTAGSPSNRVPTINEVVAIQELQKSVGWALLLADVDMQVAALQWRAMSNGLTEVETHFLRSLFHTFGAPASGRPGDPNRLGPSFCATVMNNYKESIKKEEEKDADQGLS